MADPDSVWRSPGGLNSVGAAKKGGAELAIATLLNCCADRGIRVQETAQILLGMSVYVVSTD